MRRLKMGQGGIFRRHAAAALICAAIMTMAGGGNAQLSRLDPSTFDLTPNHVFSLWVNINQCILAVAREVSDDPTFQAGLKRIAPIATTNKTPGNVLVEVWALQKQIDQIRRKDGLNSSGRLHTESVDITPSIVFLASGNVLDGLADWYVRHVGPKKLVGQFYVRRKFTNKTPNDVFQMVELAQRRLKLIRDKMNY